MSELWYPPDFADWPAEARGAWYSVNATRGEAVREVRDAIGIENGDGSKRLQKADMASAVEELSGGEHVLRVDNSLSACQSALADEVGLEEETGGKLTIEQLGIVASELRETFPTSPVPVGESWGGWWGESSQA